MSVAHRDYFNELAPEWSARMPDTPELMALLKEFGVREGEWVLDTGAGTGRMSRHLAALTGPSGRVVAQDFAFRMLQEGRRLDPESRVFSLCDDLCALGLKSGLFDSVICFSIFPHLQQPENALKEIYRVLKPEGRVLILHQRGSEALNRFHASLSGVVRHDRLCSSTAMAARLIDAGFALVRLQEDDDLYWVEAEKV